MTSTALVHVPRVEHPKCEHCTWLLFEDLLAQLWCANPDCSTHRHVVGTRDGAVVSDQLVDALTDQANDG